MWIARLAFLLTLVVVCELAPRASRAEDSAATDEAEAASPARASGTVLPQRRQRGGSAVNERVALLTAELGLDPQQQAGVTKLLERQREQINQVWGDSTVPAGNRVAATQAVYQRTADDIRGLLNEEQRKKYIAPKRPRTPAEATDKKGIDYWMDATRAKK